MPFNRQQLWKQLQDRELDSLSKGMSGVMSIDGCAAAEKVGEILSTYSFKTCLDIGCGIVPLPAYMKVNTDKLFIGLDPMFGNEPRQFPFIQAMAEKLPFPNECFEAVLYASSFDHLLDPEEALRDAYRVLKPNGLLFIWFSNRALDIPFRLQGKSEFNFHHLWGFSINTITELIYGCGFKTDRLKSLPEAGEVLLIGHKVSA